MKGVRSSGRLSLACEHIFCRLLTLAAAFREIGKIADTRVWLARAFLKVFPGSVPLERKIL